MFPLNAAAFAAAHAAATTSGSTFGTATAIAGLPGSNSNSLGTSQCLATTTGAPTTANFKCELLKPDILDGTGVGNCHSCPSSSWTDHLPLLGGYHRVSPTLDASYSPCITSYPIYDQSSFNTNQSYRTSSAAPLGLLPSSF
ncbi:hypothetical protein LOAG_08977 [Loa loa]|uniref:Uncharacterized protein n=1 Tax=Loa loa TaxID=7209 RepID=A0A1S0TTB2_LOALO|nr:hypothetical protein LOAG_08977 [Loa loa]EFO19517.1 hypothetical protein LOAG_08977 [Loa loa]